MGLETTGPQGGPHFAHVFEKGAKVAAGMAAFCTRVPKLSQVRRRDGRTLRTCSRKEPSLPQGGPHFAHVFEK